MADRNDMTLFQRLTNVIIGTGRGANSTVLPPNNTAYTLPQSHGDVLYTFDNKQERDLKLAELKQQKLLAYQWVKSGYDTAMDQMVGATQIRVMYRDSDLMDTFPEIHKALDIYSEESCCLKNGKLLNIYSKSDRIKAVLEDLFINRLNLHETLPEIARCVCKYGNDYRLLNIDAKEGILGWRMLPVYEIRRIENGMTNVYGAPGFTSTAYDLKPDEVKFVWEGRNDQQPFMNWQVAHFRMIRNSIYLPYGVSICNSARRPWRMLSMMEDGMLLYRLERSIERRIFKVNVGAMDDADVSAFMQKFANTFKRAPIIDPETGQVDLRKSYLDVTHDYFLPVRPGQDPTSIETLNAAQNITQLDDLKYMENKVFTALGVPKSYLNYSDQQSKSQNLSQLDIRFCRSVNYVQQVLLMELNKIAIIHLYCLGFNEDLTNFNLTLNNPSTQIEMAELDNLIKRLTAASTALAEQGGGLPLMSWHRVQKEILGKSDSEIADMLNEIRIENAMATELTLTPQIIKKTGLFNQADRIYGEPGAKYDYSQVEGAGGPEGGMGGGPAGGMGGFGGTDFGGGDALGDLGEPGAEEMGEIQGETGSEDLGGEGGGGEAPLQEELSNNFDKYISMILNPKPVEKFYADTTSDKIFLNEELDSAIAAIEDIKKNLTENVNNEDNETI